MGEAASAVLDGNVAPPTRGVPRTTRDVDVTVNSDSGNIDALLRTFASHGLSSRIEDAKAFALANQVTLLRHAPSGVDVDVSLAWLPFELEAINASETLPTGDANVAVARPEDLVIYKAILWRPHDQQDVERLLALHGARMDLARVRRIVAELAAELEERASRRTRTSDPARAHVISARSEPSVFSGFEERPNGI